MRSKWMTYKGQRYFFCDYANYQHDIQGLTAEVQAALALIRQQPRDSVSELVDIRNTVISAEAANLFKNVALEAKPYVRRTAVVGVTGVVVIVAQAVTKFSGLQMAQFQGVEQAQEWLVS